MTDEQGHSDNISYNSNGAPTSVTDALGHTASTAYNANGTVASETDENGNATSYSYNAQGLLSKVTPPTPLGSASYTYNSYNLVASQTDGKGQTTNYSYDALGRVTSIGYTNANGTAGGSVGYAYDADGNVLSITDTTGTTSYVYNSLNQVTKKTLPNGNSISYAYDAVGNLTSKTDGGGTVSYTYGADNEVTSVTGRSGAKTTLSYDANGDQTQIAFPNGVSESQTYNSAGQLTKIWASTSTSTLTSFSYSYTNPSTGVVTTVPYSVTDTAGNTTTYSYDANNSLTQAIKKNSAGTQLASYSYAYDAAGNTTSQTINGSSTTMSYNAAGELTQASGGINKTYSYDGNGNLTSASNGLSLVYNAADQTTGITPPGGSAISMTYTGQGLSWHSNGQRITISNLFCLPSDLRPFVTTCDKSVEMHQGYTDINLTVHVSVTADAKIAGIGFTLGCDFSVGITIRVYLQGRTTVSYVSPKHICGK